MSDEEWQEVMAQEPAEYREHPNQYQNYWYEGGWSFEIPVTIDTAQTEILGSMRQTQTASAWKSRKNTLRNHRVR